MFIQRPEAGGAVPTHESGGREPGRPHRQQRVDGLRAAQLSAGQSQRAAQPDARQW